MNQEEYVLLGPDIIVDAGLAQPCLFCEISKCGFVESLLGEEVNCRKNDLFATFLNKIWVFDGGVNRAHVQAPRKIIADRSLTFRAPAYINVDIDGLSTPKEKKRDNKIKTGQFYLFGLDHR